MSIPEVYLWIREDGQPPKAIQAGTTPPGPGVVVAVHVSRLGGTPAVEAREVLRLALAPAPARLPATATLEEREARMDLELERAKAASRVRHVAQFALRPSCDEHAGLTCGACAHPLDAHEAEGDPREGGPGTVVGACRAAGCSCLAARGASPKLCAACGRGVVVEV